MLLRYCYGVLVLIFFTVNDSQGIVIEGPSNVTYFPGRTPLPIELICNVTGFSTWRINDTREYTESNLMDGELDGHSADGANILINVPVNSTEYICISNVQGVPGVRSPPAFLYIAAAPDMIGDVMIDLSTVNVDNNNVGFTLNWTEPFANFDPIVNYTITINCTDAQCPAKFTVITTSASVNFITDLSMMTPLSVTASNTIDASNPTTIIIAAPDQVGMVDIMCKAVNVTNQCTVTWNALPRNPVAPIYYNMTYSGENITDSFVLVAVNMTTIVLPAVDSDVNVNVAAINVFGSGNRSSVTMDEIVASSLFNISSVLNVDPDDMDIYLLVASLEINPTSTADFIEVSAITDDTTIIRTVNITNVMNNVATVTLSPLTCGQTYSLAAGGLDSASTLVGPRIFGELVTASVCSSSSITSSVSIDSTMVMSPTLTMTPTTNPPGTGPSSSGSSNTGLIIGIVCAVVGACLLILGIVIIVLWCYFKSKREKSSRATSPAGGGTGVKVHTLDRYGKPIIEGDDADTGVELKGYTAKSPEFTVQTSTGPTSTFQGNDYQNEDKNRTPSAFVPEGSYDTLAPADEPPNVPSAEVVPPAQNGQSAPGAPKLNYAELEQFTRKPEAVKKHEAQPASQYAVIDPKSLQGTYT